MYHVTVTMSIVMSTFSLKQTLSCGRYAVQKDHIHISQETIRTRSEDPCSKRICFVFLASFIFLSRNYPVFTDYPDFCYQNSIRVMLSLLYLKPVKPPLMAIYLFDQIRLPHLPDGITCIIAAESGSSPSKNLFARKEHCNSKSPLKFT